jgi:hypothetical protein
LINTETKKEDGDGEEVAEIHGPGCKPSILNAQIPWRCECCQEVIESTKKAHHPEIVKLKEDIIVSAFKITAMIHDNIAFICLAPCLYSRFSHEGSKFFLPSSYISSSSTSCSTFFFLSIFILCLLKYFI